MKAKLDYSLLGKRIAEWRKRLRITQEELAYMVSISIPFLSEIENGKKKPSFNTVVSIADALGITIDELLAGNQYSSTNDYQSDIDFLLHDCTPEERRLIFETVKSLKESLRGNKWSLLNEE